LGGGNSSAHRKADDKGKEELDHSKERQGIFQTREILVKKVTRPEGRGGVEKRAKKEKANDEGGCKSIIRTKPGGSVFSKEIIKIYVGTVNGPVAEVPFGKEISSLLVSKRGRKPQGPCQKRPQLKYKPRERRGG